jgi:HlyD family secretion protein
MNFAPLKKINKKYWISAGAILLVALVLFVVNRQSQKAAGTVYQTTAAERGALASTVGATGTVRARQSATLTWQTQGRVETVNVAVGEPVTADAVLASLAEDSISQNIVLAEADLLAAQRELDNLLTSNIDFAQALQNLADAKQAVKDAQADYDRLSRVRVSDELIKQTADEITAAEDQLKRLEWVFNTFYGYEKMDDDRPAKAQMTLVLTNIRNNRDNLIAKYNWYTGKATPLELEKAQAALNLATAKMEDAQREVDRLENGPNAEDVIAARARVAAAQAVLNQSKIIAPFGGTVTQAEPQPGDMVSDGAVAFRVEDLTHLYVDLQISEVDINSVEVGQPVSLSFDAVNGKTYHGKVIKVNQAGEVTSGAVNFSVTVELTDADELVKPGMTAAVTITVREVADALLVPSRAVRVVDGQRAIYVLKDGQPVMVQVRIGAVSDSYSEVVGGGLQEGDLVILNPPAATVPSTSP